MTRTAKNALFTAISEAQSAHVSGGNTYGYDQNSGARLKGPNGIQFLYQNIPGLGSIALDLTSGDLIITYQTPNSTSS